MVSEVSKNLGAVPQVTVATPRGTAPQSATASNVAAESTPVPPAPQQEGVSAVDLQEAVSRLSEYTQSVHRSLSFQVDDSSGRTVITVSDRETDQILRQIPSEEFLELSRDLRDLQGKLLKTSA